MQTQAYEHIIGCYFLMNFNEFLYGCFTIFIWTRKILVSSYLLMTRPIRSDDKHAMTSRLYPVPIKKKQMKQSRLRHGEAHDLLT